jgi:hypothetical protein
MIGSMKIPAAHAKVLVLPREDEALFGVISDGLHCYVVDLLAHSVEMNLGMVLGYPTLDQQGNILYVERDTMQIIRLSSDLKLDATSVVAPGNISRFVGRIGSNDFIEFDGSSGAVIVRLDFDRRSKSDHIELPLGESIGSGLEDFEGKTVFLSQSDDGVKLRNFITGETVLQLDDVVDYLPKTDLRIRVNPSMRGTFVHEVIDRENLVQIRYEHLTTDPCGRLICNQETAIAFVSSVSELFRLADKRKIADLGYFPALACDSTGLRLAVLEGIDLRVVNVDTEVSQQIANFDQKFSHVQFTSDGKILLLDNRGPFGDDLAWEVVDSSL